MALQTAVPLDAQAVLNATQSGASVNEQEGWMQNLNQAAIQSQLTSYQSRLKTHIDTQKPNATVGDVIGKKILPQTVHSVLAGVAHWLDLFAAAESHKRLSRSQAQMIANPGLFYPLLHAVASPLCSGGV